MSSIGLGSLVARLEVTFSGYLHSIGWFGTRASRRAHDARGAPIPWFTYPAIALLAERVRPHLRVLEFGSGMGTLWWAGRTAECIAIEHDAAWADQIRARCPASIRQVPGDTPGDYVAAAEGLGRFHVVVVDGLHRNECLAAAMELLSEDGIVILDDAQRPEYAPGLALVQARGFRTLPMHGPQPVSKHAGCTMILYRPGNVLGL